jgi:hypothetical protein
LQIGAAGSIAAGTVDPSVHMTQNAYFDGSSWRYIQTAAAGNYFIVGNTHNWRIAPSGTAGNAISFTQAMTLDASGNLVLGITAVAAAEGYRFYKNYGRYDNGTFTGFIGAGNSLGAGSTDFAFRSENALAFLAGGATERARITSGGDLLVGTTSQPTGVGSSRLGVVCSASDYAIGVNSTNATPYGLYIRYTAASPNGTGSSFFYFQDSTTVRAYMQSNGGLANYSGNDSNLSDRREKTNFAPAKSYLDTICAIPVQTFNYIDQSEDDPGLTLGVVAQDVQAVAPELVMESNWGTAEEPKQRLSIYQTDLQYALMKCVQELKAELDSVKAELATLKGQP